MTHPGLPVYWALGICAGMLILLPGALLTPARNTHAAVLRLSGFSATGAVVNGLMRRPWLQLVMKLVFLAIFLLVIVSGMYGTSIPERNFATVITWNVWWAGLILSVFFMGSAWCGVCPWDTLSSWLVRLRTWRRSYSGFSLNLKVPKLLRNLWPALLMFVALTWLELGVGITTSPAATAWLAMLMVVLAVASAAVYEDKAFCRFFCPVGRTVGAYSQLAAIELRPIDPDRCAKCDTLECYRGNDTIAPCPTHLVMGRLSQSAYCTLCGNCLQSCPQENIGWQLRSPGREAIQDARPRWDEAWFMLGLLSLTAFHGITMLPAWEPLLSGLAVRIGDSGQLLMSFTIGLVASMACLYLFYALFVKLTERMSAGSQDFRQLFSGFSFVALPLAFAYHLAHNLNHLVRESDGIGELLRNPLGSGAEPLSMMDKHMRHMDMLISQDTLFFIQAVLMVFGFWIAMLVIRSRAQRLLGGQGLAQVPIALFAVLITLFHVWILMQPMTMRM